MPDGASKARFQSQAKAPETVPISQEAFQPADGTTVRWLTGSGFLVNSRGTVIMIDPVLAMQPGSSEIGELGMRLLNPLPLEAKDVPGLDAVFYTHTDGDHLAPLTAAELAGKAKCFAGTSAVARRLQPFGIPAAKIRTIGIGATVTIGNISITATRADHPWQELDPVQYGEPHGPEDCCGFLLHTPDGAIWTPGDTRFLPEHLNMGPLDVLLLDVSDDPYHLGVEQEIRLANHYASAVLIPHHYGSYDAPGALPFNGDPALLAPRITGAQNRLRILAPGEAYVLNPKPDSDSFIAF